MYKQALTAGAVFAALAVILGAFGAHALKAKLTPDQQAVFETGVRYQFYHCFALLITGVVYASFPVKSLRLATTFFIIGIILFSGSLYTMSMLNIMGADLGVPGAPTALGIAVGVPTPIGGLFFIMGWVAFFLGVLRKQ